MIFHFSAWTVTKQCCHLFDTKVLSLTMKTFSEKNKASMQTPSEL